MFMFVADNAKGQKLFLLLSSLLVAKVHYGQLPEKANSEFFSVDLHILELKRREYGHAV